MDTIHTICGKKRLKELDKNLKVRKKNKKENIYAVDIKMIGSARANLWLKMDENFLSGFRLNKCMIWKKKWKEMSSGWCLHWELVKLERWWVQGWQSSENEKVNWQRYVYIKHKWSVKIWKWLNVIWSVKW